MQQSLKSHAMLFDVEIWHVFLFLNYSYPPYELEGGILVFTLSAHWSVTPSICPSIWMSRYIRIVINAQDFAGLTYLLSVIIQELVGFTMSIDEFDLGPPVALTLDFRGQISKSRYFRNKWSDWQGKKGIRINTTLDSLYVLDFWTLMDPLWLWPWIFEAKFQNHCISRIDDLIDKEKRDKNQCNIELTICPWPLNPHDLDHGFSRSVF